MTMSLKKFGKFLEAKVVRIGVENTPDEDQYDNRHTFF